MVSLQHGIVEAGVMTHTGDDPRLRVAVFREEILPPSETFIRRQLEAMRRYVPALVGLRRTPQSVGDISSCVVDSLWPRSAARMGWHSPLDGRLARKLSDLSPRLVHAHFLTDAARVTKPCRDQGLPLIVTAHGYDATVNREVILDSGTGGRRLVKDWSSIVASTRLFIAVSEHLSRRLHDLGVPDSKIVVHYIGVPIPRLARQQYRHSNHLLFVGRLVEKKGVIDLIDAVAAAAATVPDLTLRIAGDGPLMTQAQDLAKSRRLDVTFLGQIHEADVAKEMSAATLLVVPSQPAANGDSEGLPTVVCEAMARGLPVVSYDSVGLNEALIDRVTGRMVPTGNPASLTAAVVDLLRDPDERQRMAARAYAHAEAHFDIVKQTAILEQIYDDVCRTPHGEAQ